MIHMQDIPLTCRDCGKEFLFTVAEQEFYKEKGFENQPVRCPECRAAKKARFNQNRGPRQMFTITCSNCGKEDQVPFKPKGDRPVLCNDCFQKQKAEGQAMQEQPIQEEHVPTEQG